MLKQAASSVLASFRPSTYPRGYAFGPSLAAALLDGLFERPAKIKNDSVFMSSSYLLVREVDVG
jgi:hypothetical protein